LLFLFSSKWLTLRILLSNVDDSSPAFQVSCLISQLFACPAKLK
jgi:hypothetical protein